MTRTARRIAWGAALGALAVWGAACSSPVSSTHDNWVTLTLNDTTWKADKIQYLNIGIYYGAASYVSFGAVHGGDTIELMGLAQQGATWSFANPQCVLRLRRPWGVYQDSANVHAGGDSLMCTTFSQNLVEGVITTNSPVARLGSAKDSVRIGCSFSLGY